MGLLGLAFALVPAVLWPSVTYLVPEEGLGSACAMMTFGRQLGWAAMSSERGRSGHGLDRVSGHRTGRPDLRRGPLRALACGRCAGSTHPHGPRVSSS
jgi:hypothetical protein